MRSLARKRDSRFGPSAFRPTSPRLASPRSTWAITDVLSPATALTRMFGYRWQKEGSNDGRRCSPGIVLAARSSSPTTSGS